MAGHQATVDEVFTRSTKESSLRRVLLIVLFAMLPATSRTQGASDCKAVLKTIQCLLRHDDRERCGRRPKDGVCPNEARNRSSAKVTAPLD